MWYLVENEPAPADSPAPRYWLGGVNSEGRLIGRKNVHIRIKQPSVSRTHAIIRIVRARRYSLSERDDAKHKRTTAVEVEDSSAYGTYVKYPEAHPAGAAEPGHHVRLGKNEATEVYEGAMLAFGAPTYWWRLGWHNVLCFVESNVEQARAMAKPAGVEIADSYYDEVTHYIVEKPSARSMTLLSALVRGAHVVTPAWLSSVRHTVQEACKLITEAQNNQAALGSARLADESHHAPTFDLDENGEYAPGVLENVFSNSASLKREDMFKGRVFAFVSEQTRAKWSQILEKLGARTLVAGSLKKGHRGGLIIVEEERKSAKRKQSSASADCVTEKCIIEAILAGDASYVVPKDKPPVVDEATDVEDEDEEGEVERSGLKTTKKKYTEDSQCTEKTTVEVTPTKHRALDNVEEEIREAEQEQDVNPCVSFEVQPLEKAVNRTASESSGLDVRRFRRKNLPRASKVPLKKARYVEEEEDFGTRKKAKRGKSSSRNSGEDADE